MDVRLEASVGNNRVAISMCFVCLIGFLLVALLRGCLGGIDANVNRWAATIHQDAFTSVAKLIADGFEATSLFALSLVIGVTLFLLKRRKKALLLVLAMTGNTLILGALKMFVYSPRPLNGLMLETDSSFPSGHTTSTVVLFGLLAFFAWQIWKSTRAKAVSIILVASLSLLVGFSRIYLNVHWLTDVLGGYFLGALWLTFCIAIAQYLVNIYEKKLKKQLKG
jgi:undecaprenyl-diphosphatase